MYGASPENQLTSAYRINRTTGAIRETPASSFATGPSPTAIAVAPSGRFVHVSDQAINKVWVARIAALTGNLTAISGSPFQADAQTDFITVDPSGGYVYTGSFTNDEVTVFNANQMNGRLTTVHLFRSQNTPLSMAFAAGRAPQSYVPKFV